MLVSNIIVLNSLIAIIGDSFDKLQSEKAFFDAQQKFGMLSELNDIYLVYHEFVPVNSSKEFVHVVSYADQNSSKNDWQGRIQNTRELITDGIASIKTKMDKQNEEVTVKISDQNKQIDDSNKEIKTQMDAMENKIKDEMKTQIDAVKNEILEEMKKLIMDKHEKEDKDGSDEGESKDEVK